MPASTMKCKLTYLEEVLGMMPTGDLREYLTQNAPTQAAVDEEMGALPAERDLVTVFPRFEDERPFFWDFQVKGMFKDTCGMLHRVPGTLSADLKAYKKVIDGIIFVHPRKCPITLVEGGIIGKCQRTLRAKTSQGERIAIAESESVPVGSFLEFEVELLDSRLEDTVKEWLDYGSKRGMGQWRNSGKGIYSWQQV